MQEAILSLDVVFVENRGCGGLPPPHPPWPWVPGAAGACDGSCKTGFRRAGRRLPQGHQTPDERGPGTTLTPDPCWGGGAGSDPKDMMGVRKGHGVSASKGNRGLCAPQELPLHRIPSADLNGLIFWPQRRPGGTSSGDRQPSTLYGLGIKSPSSGSFRFLLCTLGIRVPAPQGCCGDEMKTS